MRRVTIICLAIMLVLGGFRIASASEGFEELVQLVKAGVGDKTLVDYVNASPTAYALTVDEILYLSDLGLSAQTIEAVNAHGRSLGAAAPIAGEPASSVNTVLEQAGVDESAGPGAVAEPPVETPPAQEIVQETVVAPPVVTAPPADAADYSTFYDGLAPYGNWINEDNDWFWQPTAVLTDPAWSPYCQRGHWVYSDCGWMWQSSYSWGWAPFHYGRWRHHARYGWLWRPDRVWGPAWVCWRFSDSDVGWAPLPPEVTYADNAGLCYEGQPVTAGYDFGLTADAFTFVAFNRFCDSGLAGHRYPRARAEQLFHAASTRQNRIAMQDGRLRNFGPPVTRVTAATHQDIRPVAIVAQNVQAGAPIPRARLSGSTLAIFRPPVAPSARATPRQVVVQEEAREQERRRTTPLDDVFRPSRNAAAVQVEQARGRESRTASPVFVKPAFVTPAPAPTPAAVRVAPAISPALDNARQEQQRQVAEAAHQRQADEAAARQRDEQQRRAAELVQQQNAARQQAQEQARQQALAEQQHREADYARQQEAQRRAADLARQQEVQRQAQEASRQQEQQREAATAARAADEQRQAVRAQRIAEEAAARQQEEQARQRRDVAPVVQPVVRPPPAALPGYTDPAGAGADSSRGSASRGAVGGSDRRPFGR